MTELTTHTLEVPGATLTYDVHEPEAPTSERPLFIFGSPMGARASRDSSVISRTAR